MTLLKIQKAADALSMQEKGHWSFFFWSDFEAFKEHCHQFETFQKRLSKNGSKRMRRGIKSFSIQNLQNPWRSRSEAVPNALQWNHLEKKTHPAELSSVLKKFALVLLILLGQCLPNALADSIREALVNLCDPSKIATITSDSINYWFVFKAEEPTRPLEFLQRRCPISSSCSVNNTQRNFRHRHLN